MRLAIQSLTLMGILTLASSKQVCCEEMPLPELVLALESDDPHVTVIDDLLSRQDVWAYDLLARKILPNKRLAARIKAPAALVVAGIASHFGSTDAVAPQLRSMWAALAEPDRVSVLMHLSQLYGTKPSGLTYYVMRQEQKDLVASMMSTADWTRYGELLKDLVGYSKGADNSADELRASLKKLAAAAPDAISDVHFGAFVDAAKALRAQTIDWQEVDVPLANSFAMLHKKAESTGPMAMLETQGLEGCLRALFYVCQRADGAPSRALDAAEQLTVFLSSGSGRLDLRQIATDLNVHAEEFRLRSYLVAFVAAVAKCRYPKNPSRAPCAAPVDYKGLPVPFSLLVASCTSAAGTADAKEFIAKHIRDSVDRCGAAVAEHLKDTTDKAHRQEMRYCLTELSEIIAVTRPEVLDDAGVAKDIDKILKSLPRAESEEVRESLGDWHVMGCGEPNADRDAAISAAKKGYADGQLELYDLIGELKNFDALDDPFVYQAYKSDAKGRRSVSDHVAVCRIIGYNGTASDSAILKSMTIEGRLDTYEAIMAAGIRRGYRDLMLMLLGFYPRSHIVERRQLAAMLIGRLSSKEELPQLLELLHAEKDEKCAEYLALGVQRICLDPQDGPAALASIAGTMKGSQYGQRWFYLASVLRSLTPKNELHMYEGQKEKVSERNKEIDRAVGLVLTGGASRQ